MGIEIMRVANIGTSTFKQITQITKTPPFLPDGAKNRQDIRILGLSHMADKSAAKIAKPAYAGWK
jgi:hypothetical protein